MFHQKNKIAKKIEKNIRTIVLNILYAKKEKICLALILKHNSNRAKKSYKV